MAEFTEDGFNQIEGLIKAGQIKEARQLILQWTKKRKISRTSLVFLANFARRSGLSDVAIRLLNPYVRPSARSTKRARNEETLEYGASLINIGASTEGLNLLNTLDTKAFPKVNLFKAFAKIMEWQYIEAIPLLDQYLSDESLSEYEKLVGRVNLTASLVFVKEYERASLNLVDLLDSTINQSLDRLLANVLELAAQNALNQRNFHYAREYLHQAQNVMQKSGSIDEFFIQKWRCFLGLAEGKNKKKHLEHLYKIRQQSIELKSWETVRSCDYHQAIATKNYSLLRHLYFGTPYDSYRKNILDDFKKLSKSKENPGEEYFYHLNPESKKEVIKMSIADGANDVNKKKLKSGEVMQRTLATLCQDFYSPISLPSLHAKVFPENFYNPITSPKLIHQAFFRFRDWLKKGNIPLEIKEDQGFYQLTSQQNLVLKVKLSSQYSSKLDFLLDKIDETFGEEHFKTKELVPVFNLTSKRISTLIKQALEEGSLIRYGQGARTRYQLKKYQS